VCRITRPGGWVVLNGDDPRVFATHTSIKAKPWVFSRDPDSPTVRETLDHGGRATTVIDGWLSVLAPQSDPDPIVEVVDIPMTLAGLSRFNVENALAAASAALGVGLPREVVAEGLRSFRPDPTHNPGRMNMFSQGELTVVIDLAHNEAGLEALLEIMRGVRRPGARLLLGLGAVGDRQDELVEGLAEMGARDADVVVIGHKQRYLRGRTTDELDVLFRAGAARVGVEDLTSYPTEVEALEALVKQAEPGDVVGLMCHADREGVYAWLADHGFTVDSPETLRDKVRKASA
jgi:cyanophycin synthetase